MRSIQLVSESTTRTQVCFLYCGFRHNIRYSAILALAEALDKYMSRNHGLIRNVKRVAHEFGAHCVEGWAKMLGFSNSSQLYLVLRWFASNEMSMVKDGHSYHDMTSGTDEFIEGCLAQIWAEQNPRWQSNRPLRPSRAVSFIRAA